MSLKIWKWAFTKALRMLEKYLTVCGNPVNENQWNYSHEILPGRNENKK